MNFKILDGEKCRESFDRWADLGNSVRVQVAINSCGVRLVFVDAISSAHHYMTPEQAAAIASELLAASMVAAQAKKEAA